MIALVPKPGIVVSGTNRIVVSAGLSDIVILRGLVIATITTPGLNGIVFNAGAALHVEKRTGLSGGAIEIKPSV